VIIRLIVEQLGNSIVMGLIYGLVALGFNLIFGILGLIHFAHFEVYMIGAFGGLMAASYLKANIVIVLMAGMLSAGLLGILIEKTTFLPIREQPPESQLFASIAVSIILQNSALLLWGTEWLPFPKLIIQKNYSLGWIQVSNVQLIILALVILFLLGLRLGLYHTKIGVAIRAVSYNRSAATLMGINTDTTISITFGFASMLAGAAGVIIGLYYNMVWALMGSTTGLKAFIAVVIGGIGSLTGSVLGGLLLGMAEGLASGFISSTWSDGIAFGIFILVLLIRPSGLFGVQQHEKF
jgi:branched-chain amino acid transport system permease protein